MMSLELKKYCCKGVSLDVISNLPGDIINEILVWLPLRDAVRTSILSKKWRYKWCKLSEVTVDRYLRTTWDETINVIYHILTLHIGPIITFTLDMNHPLRQYPQIIEHLIIFLSRNGIQNLSLTLRRDYDLYKLPSSIFTCLQLRRLTLKNCSIRLPPTVFKGFGRLTSLELGYVQISSKFLESLISHCSLLEELVMHDILFRDKHVIEINAPFLRCFDFVGSITFICIKYIPLLEKISIRDDGSFGGARICDIAKFFEPLATVEHLHVNKNCIKALAVGTGDELPTRLPFNLNCVKRFYISEIYLGDLDLVTCSLFLIRSFPYLQYIQIKVVDYDENIPALECLEVESFSDVTFSHLTEVKLIFKKRIKPLMQLTELLLAKSAVLVRMYIGPIYVGSEHDRDEMLAKLSKCHRASSKAKICYTQGIF